MLQKKPVYFVKTYIDVESSNQRKGADRPVPENKAGTDARIRKSLERERGGLKGKGEAFLQKVSPFPPSSFIYSMPLQRSGFFDHFEGAKMYDVD